MPPLRKYRLFISHAWDYNAEYYRLIDMLSVAPLFEYANYSVPEHDQLPMRNLNNNLYEQIRHVSIMIILSGMYVPYRNWIQKEINMALELDKPIIGIMPWGSTRVPKAVQDVANEIVYWNTKSIVGAIRRHSL